MAYRGVRALALSRYLVHWLRSGRGQQQPEAGDDSAEGNVSIDWGNALRATAKGKGFPRFLSSAIDRPTGQGRDPLLDARLLLRDLFTPAQPVTARERFAGRADVLAKLIEIIEEQRSHVVIYGERGIGKTSLVHILADLARESHYLVIYASCGAHSRFDEVFRAILSEIPLLYLSSLSPMAPEAESGATFADRLPPGPFSERELSDLCARVTGTRVLVILDEYDRIEDPRFRQSVAELIKNLSDRAARVQLILTGVSSNLQELIGYIPSIRRNIVGLPMPHLDAAEVRALIGIGEDMAGVRFAPGAIDMIGTLANGSPYLVRLLCHHGCMKALDAGRLTIEPDDIAAALDKAAEEAEVRVSPQALRRTLQLLETVDLELMGETARAASTPSGWFSQSDIVAGLAPARQGADLRYLLTALANNDGILEADAGSTPPRYRFRDEALPVYLWMRIARERLLGAPAAQRPAAHG